MASVIGPASDFFRLRLIRLDQGGETEFEWRDDILWRQTPSSVAKESDAWVLQAVTLDDAETVLPIASFESRDGAVAALQEANEDLDVMTRAEFESEYLQTSGPAQGSGGRGDDSSVASSA